MGLFKDRENKREKEREEEKAMSKLSKTQRTLHCMHGSMHCHFWGIGKTNDLLHKHEILSQMDNLIKMIQVELEHQRTKLMIESKPCEEPVHPKNAVKKCEEPVHPKNAVKQCETQEDSEPEDTVVIGKADLPQEKIEVVLEVSRESERKEPKVPDAKKDAPSTTIVVAPPVKNDVGTSTNQQKAELNEVLVKLLSILPTLLKDNETTSLPQGTGN